MPVLRHTHPSSSFRDPPHSQTAPRVFRPSDDHPPSSQTYSQLTVVHQFLTSSELAHHCNSIPCAWWPRKHPHKALPRLLSSMLGTQVQPCCSRSCCLYCTGPCRTWRTRLGAECLLSPNKLLSQRPGAGMGLGEGKEGNKNYLSSRRSLATVSSVTGIRESRSAVEGKMGTRERGPSGGMR